MTIKAITFDFWGTLYFSENQGEDRLREFHQRLQSDGFPDLTWEETRAAAQQMWQHWDAVWRTEQRTIGAREWLTGFSHRLNLALAGTQLQAMVDRMEQMLLAYRPAVVEGVPAMLAHLSRRYALAVISDTGLTPGRVLHQILVEDGLSGYFRHFTFSDEVGRSKPHPSVYLSTLAALEATPAAAVHIGDLPFTDIIGAQRVGMRAIRFKGVKDTDDPQIRADAVIDSYAELAAVLQDWEAGAT
ncbi:MAG: HAD family hydrolase [Anaerolineae bacterium]